MLKCLFLMSLSNVPFDIEIREEKWRHGCILCLFLVPRCFRQASLLRKTELVVDPSKSAGRAMMLFLPHETCRTSILLALMGR